MYLKIFQGWELVGGWEQAFDGDPKRAGLEMRGQLWWSFSVSLDVNHDVKFFLHTVTNAQIYEMHEWPHDNYISKGYNYN